MLKLTTNPHNNPVFSNNPVSFLGWSIKEELVEDVAAIHHPLGDVQKISFGEDLGTYIDIDDREYWSYHWHNGITQPNSSGSPFFNENKKVIGAVTGREPPHSNIMDCNYGTNTRPLSGKLHLTWEEFGQFLDPDDENIVETSTIVNQSGAIIKSQITGPDVLCTTETYTLQNPAIGGVSWEASPTHFFTNSSGTGTTANLSLSSSTAAGTATLTYTFPGLGTSNNQITKQIQVGPEYPDFDFYYFPTCTSPNQVITVVANITQVDYDWTVNGGSIMSGQGTQSIDIMVGGSGFISVHCFVSNGPLACGGPRGTVSLYPMSCFNLGESNVTIYPNPVKDILHLKSETEENFTGEILLIDAQNNLRKSVAADGCEVAIDVVGLQPGVYHVTYTVGGKYQVKRIRIE
ncbi:T9SS type A sorting domain-containing protein [Negadavirga shengliensis]|uniref:T9SS type A sorting domain-containing protein n=1 Tax=Negadavirga shengliensis TaxID=1389218 RepID=A0ABV9T4T9_9BACT